MKKFVVLVILCTAGACSWNKQGPIFPDVEEEEVVQYQDGTMGIKEKNTQTITTELVDSISQERTAMPVTGYEYAEMQQPQFISEEYQMVTADSGEYPIMTADGAEYQMIAAEGTGYQPAGEIIVDDFSPEVYTVLAARAVNRLIDETSNIHEVRKTPTIYVNKIIKESNELPNGTFYADKTVKNILEGSKTFNVINNVKESDYQLKSHITSFSLDGVPAIRYKLLLIDRNGQTVRELSEVIQQVSNDDKSWW